MGKYFVGHELIIGIQTKYNDFVIALKLTDFNTKIGNKTCTMIVSGAALAKKVGKMLGEDRAIAMGRSPAVSRKKPNEAASLPAM